MPQKPEDDDQKEPHECVYTGSYEGKPLDPIKNSPLEPPSEPLVRTVTLGILCGGRGCMKSLPHFKRRMKLRNFDIFDVIYVVRNGACIKVEYCDEFEDHKFTFRGLIDGLEFDATFALSARYDLVKAPLLFLITGVWKNDSGTRFSRY